jgi:hypothetical protein
MFALSMNKLRRRVSAIAFNSRRSMGESDAPKAATWFWFDTEVCLRLASRCDTLEADRDGVRLGSSTEQRGAK